METIKTYTVKQVAEILQTTVDTVRAIIRRGELKSFRLGKCSIRVLESELLAYCTRAGFELKFDRKIRRII